MRHLLDETLYAHFDKDEIIRELIKYICCNNTYEHELKFPGEPFVSTPTIVPEEIMMKAVTYSFGAALVEGGNALKVQSIFISNYMTHISKYLNRVGVKFYFTFFKPSDLVNMQMDAKISSGDSLKDVITDFSKSEAVTDPFNIFYNLCLVIHTDNVKFIEDMDKIFGRLNNSKKPTTVVIKMLPSTNLNHIKRVVELIHKHF